MKLAVKNNFSINKSSYSCITVFKVIWRLSFSQQDWFCNIVVKILKATFFVIYNYTHEGFQGYIHKNVVNNIIV